MKLGTLFDFNGVLVDDEHLHHRAMAEVVLPLGIVLTEADYFGRYFALDDAGALRAILKDAQRDASDANVRALVEKKKPVYLAHAEHARLFEGGAALVAACADAGPVAIVSGALRHEIELFLQRMDVTSRIAAIVSADETTVCKPDPQGYVMGMAALRDAGADAFVAIEDSPGGVRAARAAKIPVVAVLHSVPEAALVEAGADRIVRELASIDVPLLRSLARAVDA